MKDTLRVIYDNEEILSASLGLKPIIKTLSCKEKIMTADIEIEAEGGESFNIIGQDIIGVIVESPISRFDFVTVSYLFSYQISPYHSGSQIIGVALEGGKIGDTITVRIPPVN